ncbi:MAG: hypothetical protein ACRD2L_22215, partial [Terriglobia bacterium]
GIAMEICQAWVPGRCPSLFDVLFDLGGAIGALVGARWYLAKNARRALAPFSQGKASSSLRPALLS